MRRTVVIGSRGSPLAMWQSRHVAALLGALDPGLDCRIEVIRTTGDRLQAASLQAISGKGAFTKEIEEALLDGRVDVAVHSLKDLPTAMPEGLVIAGIPKREDARDALIGRTAATLATLPPGARIGTSSPRRRSQLLSVRPDLVFVDLRGNVDTRLRKLDSEGLDAIVLACAGLYRLGLQDRITEAIDLHQVVPAVGQGALGIETRSGDLETRTLIGRLTDEPTLHACRAERAFLAAMGGGCALPIAAHGIARGDELSLIAAVAGADGVLARAQVVGCVAEAEAVGKSLASALTH
jgi:hydroxymethylbilane synthase